MSKAARSERSEKAEREERRQGGLNRRRSHHGYVMNSLVTERIIRVCASTFTRDKLLKLDYPQEFIWPIFEDYDGCEHLINAVMARDCDLIRKINAQHPLFDFGLTKWMEGIERAQLAEKSDVVRVLKTKRLNQQLRLDTVLENNTTTGVRKIVEVITDGKRRISSRVLAVDDPSQRQTNQAK